MTRTARGICADDVYFADGQPLDTDNVNAWLTALTGLDLTDYVSYNVTNEELQTFGLDEPALTITLDYSSSDEDGTETDAGTLVLHLSQNPEELAAYGEALANEEDDLRRERATRVSVSRRSCIKSRSRSLMH